MIWVSSRRSIAANALYNTSYFVLGTRMTLLRLACLYCLHCLHKQLSCQHRNIKTNSGVTMCSAHVYRSSKTRKMRQLLAVHICTHAHIHAHTNKRAQTHFLSLSLSLSHTRTHTHAYIHAHKCVCVCVHMSIARGPSVLSSFPCSCVCE